MFENAISKGTPYAVIRHRLGEWNVFVHALDEIDEDVYMEQFRALGLHITAVDTSWRTVGLAIGYIKRLAKNSPDCSSEFHLIPWHGTYTIYFGGN